MSSSSFYSSLSSVSVICFRFLLMIGFMGAYILNIWSLSIFNMNIIAIIGMNSRSLMLGSKRISTILILNTEYG